MAGRAKVMQMTRAEPSPPRAFPAPCGHRHLSLSSWQAGGNKAEGCANTSRSGTEVLRASLIPVRGPRLPPRAPSTEREADVPPRFSSMERPLTVLRVSLYHPSLGPHTSASVPPRLQHDTSPLLVGRGRDAHLQLQLPHLSRRHLSLEPYLEKGGTLLVFCLKVLSRRGRVWVNGLTLRFLEQVPLSPVSWVSFSGVQMLLHVEGGPSLEAFTCCFSLSPSPLVCRPKAEESDEWESTHQEQPAPGPGATGHLHFPHGPSQPCPGGGAQLQPWREPLDAALC
ncbi:TRAF-interacting protein with FHA domain-containing protein B isoform X1 [Oryctolagus cuniculus]|uniref:TRAF-interacting protein with FHA domain-containing protein B isoform X1 n=2 Tax=Oryctolagus cuniculus TaxID=9986 RepID=UPI00387A80FC